MDLTAFGLLVLDGLTVGDTPQINYSYFGYRNGQGRLCGFNALNIGAEDRWKKWYIGKDGFAYTKTWPGYIDVGCCVFETGEPGMSGLTLWNGHDIGAWSIGKSKGRLT